MGIADDMKRITDNIVASYDARVKVLGDLVEDTKKTLADARKTVRGFSHQRKEMGEYQAKKLSDFVKGLSKDVAAKLKDFRGDLKKISGDRTKMAEELRDKLAKEAKQLKNDVKKRLKEFSESHAAMSEDLKKNLAEFVKDIARDVKKILEGTRKLIGEYSSDMKKAGSAWQGMASSLKKSRKGGVMGQIEAGKEVKPVEEEIIEEVKKRVGRKKKGKKR